MEAEYFLHFEVYFDHGVGDYTFKVAEELFHKFIDDFKVFHGDEIELHTSWEDTVEDDGIKYAKIRNYYVVKDIMGNDLEIAYKFFYLRLEDGEICEF